MERLKETILVRGRGWESCRKEECEIQTGDTIMKSDVKMNGMGLIDIIYQERKQKIGTEVAMRKDDIREVQQKKSCENYRAGR